MSSPTEMFGKRCLIRAATAEAAGADMLVPAVHVYAPAEVAGPRLVDSTMSNAQQGMVTGVVVVGSVHSSSPS